jgi:hypothetical protein
MRTIRTLLIALCLSLTLVTISTANTSLKGPKKVVELTFNQAVQIDWVIDLMNQLESDFLSTTQPTYTIEILHNNAIIRISGSYNQWAWFFRLSGPNIDSPPNLKQVRWR